MIERLVPVLLLCTPALAQTNAPVSVSSSGALANDDSYYSLISADGRYVVFQSEASNLTTNDSNGQYDIFRRDLQAGVTELVSVGLSGSSASGLGLSPTVSGDGRYVAWSSNASNVVAGDTNATWDVFLRDMVAGVTTRISLTSTGAQAPLRSDQPRITPDGDFVTFESDADLIPADTNGLKDCYLLDRTTNTLALVSTSSTGTLGDSISYAAQPSDDGRYVCFFSAASNLVAGDTNNQADVFWKDMQTGAVQRVNVSTAGAQANNESIWPSISGDGQTVTFCSVANTLVAGDTNGQWDLFARDVPAGVTTRLNLQPNGAQADSYVRSPSALTADGRYVIFASLSTNLVAGDTNGAQDIFIRDRVLEVTERVSFGYMGDQTDSDNFVPHMTPDKAVITYTSTATNVVPGDTNGFRDIFASTLAGPADPSTGFCLGDGSASACPCGNESAPGAGAGCANSSGPGAALVGSGSASVAADDLGFEATGLLTGQPALLFVGENAINGGAGIPFGDGLRCAGMNVVRLGVRTPDAMGGATWGPGLGATAGWAPGDTRYFQCWYRDPIGSPCGALFNLSNGAQVTFTN